MPATVEDEDERGQPVSGTKHAAVALGRPLQDTRSDSGYSSHTHRTLASADSAKAPPVVPDPPAPAMAPLPPVEISPEIKPLSPTEQPDRPPSPSKKHRRASSKTSRLSRDRTSSRSSRNHPQRCHDPTCPELHFDQPVILPHPPLSPQYYAYHHDDAYDPYHHLPQDPYRRQPPLPLPPTIESPSRADRALRRTSRTARPQSYHEDMRRDLALQFRTFAPVSDAHTLVRSRDGSYYHHDPEYPFPPQYEPHTLRDSYFDAPGERPPLRHAITDAPGSRRSYIDGSDSYHARMAAYARNIRNADRESRRRSFHGSLYPTMRPSRSPERSPLYPPEPIPSPLYGPPSHHYDERAITRDDPRTRFIEYYREEPSISPRERESSPRRQSSSAAYRDIGRPEQSSRRSSFVSHERQSSRPAEYTRRKSSSKSSVSPRRATEARSSRRPSHSTHREEVQTVRRDSSQAQSPVDGKLSEANKYMDQTRGGPLEDDLAATLRQAYSTSSSRRPGLIGNRQPSVTSRTSSKSHHSHAKHSGGDTRSRSSRRNSDYHVRVQIVNDTNGEELQSYRVPMRDGRPLHFTVDEGGGLSRFKDVPRSEKPSSSSSSRWSWITGGSRSGRSRAGSDIDPDDRRGRRRLSIRSPIIEGPREGQAWGGPGAR